MKATRRIICTALALITLLLCGCSAPEPDFTDYDWGSYLKKDAEWYSSDEGKELLDKILAYQLPDGGWRKPFGDTTQTGSWAKSTVDNSATTVQIRILAKAYNATGKNKYKSACIDGIQLLLDMQYDNGGWPQIYKDEGTYHAHITYNDNAMVNVLNILTEVRDKSGDFSFVPFSLSDSANIAVTKGIECILNTQIIVDGKYTGWCQQYDEFTLLPTMGRAYELASISSSESVKIVQYLQSIENPSEEITERIDAAIEWFKASKLEGIRVESFFNTELGEEDKRVVADPEADPIWARFYYIEDGVTPMFVSRDSFAKDDWGHIGAERRTGYAWYGSWPAKLIK